MGIDLRWYLNLDDGAVSQLKSLGFEFPGPSRDGFFYIDLSRLFTLVGYPGEIEGEEPYYLQLVVPPEDAEPVLVESHIRERDFIKGDPNTGETVRAVLAVHKFLLSISSWCVLLTDSYSFDLTYSASYEEQCRTIPFAKQLEALVLPPLPGH